MKVTIPLRLYQTPSLVRHTSSASIATPFCRRITARPGIPAVDVETGFLLRATRVEVTLTSFDLRVMVGVGSGVGDGVGPGVVTSIAEAAMTGLIAGT